MQKHIKILGAYLIFVSLAHFCLYVAMNVSHGLEWLVYFDSRFAFFFIEAVIKKSEGRPPALTAWMIEFAVLALGILMVKGRAFLKTYVLFETLLTIPYLLFFALVFAANLRANHGFSRGELFLPSIVVAVNSLLPVTYAVWIIWRRNRESKLS